MIRPVGAKFITSAPNINLADEFAISEVVFLGRSNVGKSSLINALVGQNSLAKSSSTPGKTRLINFFEVSFSEVDENLSNKEILNSKEILNNKANLNNKENLNAPQIPPKKEKFKLIFVDLPGFGYAKVAKSMLEEWKKSLDEYLKFRTNIRLFIHLIDARHFDLKIDNDVKEYLKSFLRADQKVLNLYTKADKLNQSAKSALLKHDPSTILVSITNKKSIDHARELITKKALGQA